MTFGVRDPFADILDSFAEATRQLYALQMFDLQLERSGDIKLAHLIVPKGDQRQGKGTAAMDDLCAFADLHARRILLSPGRANKEHGTTSRRRLVLFYKRFGFVENSGRRKDFTTMAGMYRHPLPEKAAHGSAHSLSDISRSR